MKEITYDTSAGKNHVASASMLAVYNGRECLGFILNRGKLGAEAFDRDERSLGIFATQREAADAISGARQ